MFLNILDPVFILAILLAIVVIILLVIYLFETVSYSKLYKKVPINLGKEIYGYLDKNGDLINFTDDFFNLINESKQKNYKKVFKKIYYQNKDISYKQFLKTLKNQSGSLNFLFELEQDNFTVTFKKNPIFDNDKVIGYVLMQEDVESKANNLDDFINILDDLDSPCAYFYGENENTNFTINQTLQKILQTNEQKMTYESLKKYVFEEDLENFYRSSNETVNDIRTQYRLLTKDGLVYFEEIKKFKDGKVTSLIMHIDVIDEKVFVEKNDLDNTIDEFITNQVLLGGIVISFKSLLENKDYNKVNILKDVTKKYLKIIRKDILDTNDVIGKLNEYEYVILFTNIDKLDSTVNDICDNNSILLNYDILFCGENIAIANKLGISYFDNNMINRKDFYNSLYQSLALANDKVYEKDFSIYTKASEKEEKEEYSFENCKIDLDNSFLYDDK